MSDNSEWEFIDKVEPESTWRFFLISNLSIVVYESEAKRIISLLKKNQHQDGTMLIFGHDIGGIPFGMRADSVVIWNKLDEHGAKQEVPLVQEDGADNVPAEAHTEV